VHKTAKTCSPRLAEEKSQHTKGKTPLQEDLGWPKTKGATAEALAFRRRPSSEGATPLKYQKAARPIAWQGSTTRFAGIYGDFPAEPWETPAARTNPIEKHLCPKNRAVPQPRSDRRGFWRMSKNTDRAREVFKLGSRAPPERKLAVVSTAIKKKLPKTGSRCCDIRRRDESSAKPKPDVKAHNPRPPDRPPRPFTKLWRFFFCDTLVRKRQKFAESD